VIALACLPFATAPWEDHAGQSTDGPTFAFPKGILALVGLVAFCSSIGEGAMADWSAVYITGATQASEQSAALGYAAFSVAMVTVRFLGDRAIHAFGPVKAARISGLFAATGATLVVTVPTLGTILLGFALMGVGYAVIVPLAFSRAANDPHLSQGRAIASVATLGYGGTLLGPAIIGGIAEVSSLQMSFSLLAVLALVMVALARVMRPA
jgi:MFS family permease